MGLIIVDVVNVEVLLMLLAREDIDAFRLFCL
jgi:hypothetical protein